MKLFISFFLSLTLFVPCSYLYGQDSSPLYNPKVNSNVFGCLFPLSGEYELIGEKALKGVLAAADTFYSDSGFQVIVKDTGKGAQEIKKAFEELVREDGVSFIIGPILSTSVNEIIGSVESLQIPTVVFPLSGDSSPDSPYLIKFSYSLEEQAEVLARYAVEEVGIKTFGVLYPKTRLGGLFKEAFVKSVKRMGKDVTYTGSYDSNLTDVSTEIEWIKSIHPEAVFIPDGATRSGELIIRLKGRVSPSGLLFLGPNTWNSSAFLKAAGTEVDGTLNRVLFTDFFSSDSRKWIDFSTRFKSDFGEEPGFLEYQVYEAVKLILYVLKTPIEKREEVIERLLIQENNRLFNITRRGNGSLEVSPKPLILTVQDGKILEVR